MLERKGWSVAIKRDDGTEFLCSSEKGILPPVWVGRRGRQCAVDYKRYLIAGGFKARVVPVLFHDVQIEPAAGKSGGLTICDMHDDESN